MNDSAKPGTTRATRYYALDGMRGWLSLVVALGHLRFYGNFYDSELLYGMYMMIDYFFVLSGFVIAHSSLTRLGSWSHVYTFMIRRFGRVYPMHLLVLCAFLAMELLKLLVTKGQSATPPFSAPYTAESLPANFLLLQSWNLFDTPTWNMPAWSISTEFYVYILFALSVFLLGKRLPYVAPLLIAGSTLVLYFNVQNGDATYLWGGARCIAGFYCGYLLYLVDAPSKARVRARISPTVFSVLELATVFGVAYFMHENGHTRWALLAPYIFTWVTWLFSFDAGVFSRALRIKPIQVLGEISFTTYIIHFFVWEQLERVLRMAEKRLGVDLFVVHGTWEDGSPAELFSIGSPALMDVLAWLAVFSLAGIAWLISRGIEMPILKWFQDVARKKDQQLRAARMPAAEAPVAPG
ncbi:MAG: acyltransferase [Polyangiales bacterium]